MADGYAFQDFIDRDSPIPLYLQVSADMTRRIAEEEWRVGDQLLPENTLAELYQQTTGKPLSRFYRPPQGKYSEENLKQAQALGYKTVFWSLAYVDWNTDSQPTAEQAYAKLLPRIHDGAIVLLHSTSRTNAEILDDLLTKWEAMGYTFASLEELPGV